MSNEYIKELEYYRDRYKMLAESSGALAEYRMYRIMELEEKLQMALKIIDELQRDAYGCVVTTT